jgi:hypothetical protein
MDWAALITWIVTAGGGFLLLAVWLKRGGMKQTGAGGSRIRPRLIMCHFLLAVVGLVLWIVYLATDSDALAWIAFAVIAVVAVLGFAMFGIWLKRRNAPAAAAEKAVATRPAEQHFPVSVVGLHGVLAAATLVLVFLSAVGVGS